MFVIKHPEFVPSDRGTMVDEVQKKTCVIDPVDGRYITLSTRNLFGDQTTSFIAHVAQLQKNGGVFTQIHLQNRPAFFGGYSVRSFVIFIDLYNCSTRTVKQWFRWICAIDLTAYFASAFPFQSLSHLLISSSLNLILTTVSFTSQLLPKFPQPSVSSSKIYLPLRCLEWRLIG